MSIEQLESDLTANMDHAKGLTAMSSVGDVVFHVQKVMWPFIANVVTEQADMDRTLADLYENAEDILQPETAKIFAVLIAGGRGLIGELDRRLDAKNPTDAKLKVAIGEWRTLAKEAEETLLQITVIAEDDDAEDPDDPDAEDEDEDDEDEDDDAPDATTPEAP